MDVRAWLAEPVTLHPLERKLIPTGLYIALPEGYEAQIRPRSGLALKRGLTVLNTPGTIDADYRGEIGVILINMSQVGDTPGGSLMRATGGPNSLCEDDLKACRESCEVYLYIL